MIISASRRTDIPAFYSEWFLNRLKEGFLYVRNPFRLNQIYRITLNPDIVDCIVFWTKNPSKIIQSVDKLSGFNYYFLITINPYDKEIEPNVGFKSEIIESFAKLSGLTGSARTVWRYDPVLFSNEIDLKYHLKNFEEFAKQLSPYTAKCIISFIDNYKKCSVNLIRKGIRQLSEQEVYDVAYGFMNIAARHNLTIETCAEKYELSQFGIGHAKCIDTVMIEKIIKRKLVIKKDKNQRKECGCAESIDIGTYNTCDHNCIYCYANSDSKERNKIKSQHYPESPMLTGYPLERDIIIERNQESCINTLYTDPLTG